MSTDAHGPIDYLLLQFPPGADMSEAGAQLLGLVDVGIVRIFDLLVIRKEEDGSFSGVDVNDLSDQGIGAFTAFAGARSGMVDDEDLSLAAGVMDTGTVAVLIVYENTWAAGFVGAALGAGAQLIASARIPATTVMEALDALESAS
jgi:hypothetical protein